MTYDGTALRLYVNGVLVGTDSASGSIQTSTSPLWIGGNQPYGEHFAGTIDEARVYNRALSVTEIQTVMANPLVPSAPDTSAPTAPTGLTATAAGAGQINLSWTASTDNVGVNGYEVERCLGAGCSGFAAIGTPTGTTFANTGLAASTAYTYRVRATDLAGNVSAYSATASASTTAAPDTTAPTVPTGLAATVAGTTQINLAWTASTDNVGVTGYRVERCQGSGCTSWAQVGTPATSVLRQHRSDPEHGLPVPGAGHRCRRQPERLLEHRFGHHAGRRHGRPQHADRADRHAGRAEPGEPGLDGVDRQRRRDRLPGRAVPGCRAAPTFAQIGTPTSPSFADTGVSPSTAYRYPGAGHRCGRQPERLLHCGHGHHTGAAGHHRAIVPGGVTATAAGPRRSASAGPRRPTTSASPAIG